jgi:AcrR family transcriptional regulator
VPQVDTDGGAPDPAATRARILAAAEQLYLVHGVAATTLSAVAKRAGVSRPTVYKHFGDARNLAGVVIDRELSAFFEQLVETLAAHEGVREQLVEGLAFTLEYARGHELLQRLLELESETVLTALTTGATPVLERAIDLLEPELSAAAERGELAGSEPAVAAEWVARIGLSLVLTPSVTRDLSDGAELRSYVAPLVTGGLVTGSD